MSLAMISLDAVSSEDTDYLMTLEHFPGLAAKGCLVTEVESVFLSNTYPAHASIITGVHPNRHGIADNTFTQPEKEVPDWRWYRKYIKGTTLYDEAAGRGLRVCNILWPVTAGANIRYNMPEIFSNNGRSQVTVSLSAGSKWFQLSSFLRYGRLMDGIRQPNLDDFATACALHALKKLRFDLLLLHLVDVDSHKHSHGPGSPEARQALERMDRRLGKIRDACPGWDIIVLGDHGCLPVKDPVDLNRNWPIHGAHWHMAGGCAFLKAQDNVYCNLDEAVRRILNDPDSHVRRLLSPAEMQAGGLGREFLLGVEAEAGWCFGTGRYLGQHGYSLENPGYRTFYLAAGKGVETGTRLKGGCIVDIAPLAAALLGIPLWNMDGQLRVRVQAYE